MKRTIVATARGKKKPNDRALMLRSIMPLLSGDRGKELANAIKKKNASKVESIMDDIKDDLTAKIGKK